MEAEKEVIGMGYGPLVGTTDVYKKMLKETDAGGSKFWREPVKPPGGVVKPPPKKEKAFDDVIKDAEKLEGLFHLYQKEDKLFMEIQPDQFGKRYLFIPTLWRSLGRGGAGR